MSEPRDLVVDLIADPTCPWCYVGWRGLAQAAAARGDVTLRVIWRPFLLRPDTPPEGMDRREAYAERAAADPDRWAAMRKALEAAAAEAEAPLDLDAPKRLPSAIDSHRLMLWAAGQERGAEAADALFTAYWVKGRDIGAADVLCDVAAAAGLDPAVVGELLATEADRDRVLAMHQDVVDMGIGGVPVMVLNRKLMRMGAESPATYAEAIAAALG